MLDELLALTDTVAFEENGFLRVTAMTMETPSRLTNLCDVETGIEDEDLQHWQLTCDDFRMIGTVRHPTGSLAIVEDHPLLRLYDEPKGSLYISGPAASVSGCIGALWERHHALFGDWVSLATFLNESVSLRDLFGSSGGLLACGPVAVLRCYIDALQNRGLGFSLIDEQRAGADRQTESPRLRVALFDRWYVIARSFEADRLAKRPAKA